jgi:cytochrome c553
MILEDNAGDYCAACSTCHECEEEGRELADKTIKALNNRIKALERELHEWKQGFAELKEQLKEAGLE